MLNLARRNIRIFFRQKSAVFFSLLGVLIIITLYIVFLGDVWALAYDLPEKDVLMNSWIMAGIVAVTSTTTTMGAFGIMVEDRVRKTSKDFLSAPITRVQLVGGYALCAYMVGSVLSVLALFVGQIYIVASGGAWLGAVATLKALGIIMVAAFMSCGIVFFIDSFFYTTSAFTSASTVLGTLIGFLTGMYIPIGSLPQGVQWVVRLFPVTHTAALMRQVMMETPIAYSFAGIPESHVADFKELTGVSLVYGEYTATPLVHLLVLVGTGLLFFTLAVLNISRKSKKGF